MSSYNVTILNAWRFPDGTVNSNEMQMIRLGCCEKLNKAVIL